MLRRLLLSCITGVAIAGFTAVPAFAATQGTVKNYEIPSCGYNQIMDKTIKGTESGVNYTLYLSIREDFNSYDGFWCNHEQAYGSITTKAALPSGKHIDVVVHSQPFVDTQAITDKCSIDIGSKTFYECQTPGITSDNSEFFGVISIADGTIVKKSLEVSNIYQP